MEREGTVENLLKDRGADTNFIFSTYSDTTGGHTQTWQSLTDLVIQVE